MLVRLPGGSRLRRFVRPSQALKQIAREILFRRERSQPIRGRAFQIDRHPIRQLDGAPDLVVLRAGHDLQVDEAGIGIFAPDDLDRVEDFVLRRHAAFDDPRRQEQPLDHFRALKLVKRRAPDRPA